MSSVPRNYTKLISVSVRWTENPALLADGDARLFHELFLDRRLSRSVDDFTYMKLQMPRDQRDYSQSKGNESLDDALKKEDIETNLTFSRVCSTISCNDS